MKNTESIETPFEIVPADLGLDLVAKNSLEIAFQGFFSTAKGLQKKADAITCPKAARAARLEMKGLRIEVEKKHKEMKADSLLFGRAVDGAKNIFLAIATPIERQLDDIEKAEERKEAARIEALREERVEVLDSLGHVSHGINLGNLSEDEWKAYLQQAKDVYEVRQAREKKAKEEAEAAARKEAEEREAQRLENIRLKEEAEKREAELKAEREAAAAAAEAARKEREEIEAKARAEREKAAAIAKAEADEAMRLAAIEREKLEAAAAEERRKAQEAAEKAAKEKAAIEAEAQRLRDADAKRKADEEAKAKAEAAAKKKAAAAPDKAKLLAFATTLRGMTLPSLSDQMLAAQLFDNMTEFVESVEAQAATL